MGFTSDAFPIEFRVLASDKADGADGTDDDKSANEIACRDFSLNETLAIAENGTGYEFSELTGVMTVKPIFVYFGSH